MLSYQHDHHAGNHADVLKHAVFALLIEALQRDPMPLRVLDTHAGAGLYDLTTDNVQRAREYRAGIARVIEAQAVPPELGRYVEIVTACNSSDLRWYPGSPEIARSLLREVDHLELFELHRNAHAALERLYSSDRRVHFRLQDGFEALPLRIPPPEHRGIVLIDPSYDARNDFKRVLEAVPAAHRRWQNGVLAVWYPLLRSPEATSFVRQLRALALPRLYQVEIKVASAGSFGLLGSGLLIANLPYGLDAQLATLVPWLHHLLADEGAGGWQAGWLSAA